MHEEKNQLEKPDPSFKPLMRSLALELVIYVPSVTLYFIPVLMFSKGPLVRLYNEMPVTYAIIGTLMVLGQGVLLEAFTSWLLRRIGIRH
jgi:hypothetical protein